MFRGTLSFLILILSTATAIPVSPLDLTRLTEEADLVVIAGIKEIVKTGSEETQIQGIRVPMNVFMARARASEVLKGDLGSAEFQVQFELPRLDSAPVKYRGLSVGTTRLLFLKNSSTGYEFADPTHPSVPAAIDGSADHDPIKAVIGRVAAAVASETTPVQEKIEAVIALRTSQSPVVAPSLRRALGLPDAAHDPELRAYLLAELINHGDTSALPTVQGILMGRESSFPDYLMHNLSYSLSKIRDTNAAPQLQVLLSAPRDETRRYAAEGLRNLGAAAIPGLVLALNNRDPSVRYSGVIGLADLTDNGKWRPSQDEFNANEAKYLEYWRSWAKEH